MSSGASKVMRFALEAIKDAQRELEQDEVAELTSAALDRKLEKAVRMLEEELRLGGE